MGESSEFDLAAAWSRRARSDLPAFMAALAERLEGALPGQVKVERARKGFFSGSTHVARIVVQIENWRYEAAAHDGRLGCRRGRVVRDVALSAQDLPVTEWLAGLAGELRSQGERDGRGSEALQAFLLA